MRIAVATLGCKVNQCESASICAALRKLGHEIVSFPGYADAYVINTCTVTQATDHQSRNLVRRANRANPCASIVVTGCYAQVSPEAVSGLPGVVLVAPNGLKSAVPELISDFVKNHARDRAPAGAEAGGPALKERTRAFLKVQDGCNARCSYCIVPLARGPSRSIEPAFILDEISALEKRGVMEIVLTGIHLGSYGLDIDPGLCLHGLLKTIEERGFAGRMRLSSIEPLEFTPQIIEILKTSGIFCPHLHIPLQSGSDRVLASMNRNYTSGQYADLIERIVNRLPDAAIGADVMVGFPGETESDFEQTLRLVEDLPLSYVHVFSYSGRPGTAAAKFPGQIPNHIKKERSLLLRTAGRDKRKAYCERFIGCEIKVLIEGRHDGNGRLQGYSEHYVPVLVEAPAREFVNRIVTLRATGIISGKLTGTLNNGRQDK